MLSLARRADGGPLRIGHRGAAALAPANSLAAIDAGLAVGLDGVEIDVVAGDGRLLVAHSVHELGPDSPPLDAVLKRIAASPAFLDLDLKADGVEEELLEALRRHGLLERTIVTSFLRSPLRRLALLEPGLLLGRSFPNDRAELVERGLPDALVRAGLLAMRALLPLDVVRFVRGSSARVVSVHHGVVSDPLVRRCHSHGISVLAWTANDPGALDRLAALGVDAVITDDPRIFV
jgi:glycerophosphoryl diester phosphodiesterase